MKIEHLPVVNAHKQDFIVYENLPYPYVHYPDIVGPFLGFSETHNGEIFLCSCFKQTLINYVILRKKELAKTHGTYNDPYCNCLLSSSHFPYSVAKNFVDNHIPNNVKEIVSLIHFKDGLCHQCNKKSPIVRVNYCNMSSFESTHAWYVKKRFLDIGLWSSENHLPCMPAEYLDLFKIIWELNDKGWSSAQSGNYANANKYYREAANKSTIIHRLIENDVRSAFDYPLIGERWKEETTLYNIVRQLLPDYSIKRHYRPDWLDRLELDIFIPNISLGIEYQGIQHFCPIKHWGGKNGLVLRQEHDSRKLQLAKAHGVSIAYFTYADYLTIDSVSERLKAYIH